MKRKLKMKNGDALEIAVSDMTITEPRLREMIVSLYLVDDEIWLGTVMTHTKLENIKMDMGAVKMKMVFVEHS